MSEINPYKVKFDSWSSHSKILNWVSDIAKKNIVVEVGIAEGILGKIDQNRDYRLIGIEVNENWANSAQKYYDQIIIGDVQVLDKDVFLDADCIILADILEHLPNPDDTLVHLASFLPQNGFIILSVPNVANLWIRLNLLFGKFNYTERGILDKSHLRFFTKKTFLELIHKTNLNIEDLAYTSIPLNLIHPFFTKHKTGVAFRVFLDKITRIFPSLLAYQFMAFCKKP